MDRPWDNPTSKKDIRIIWITEELSEGRNMLWSEQRGRQVDRQAAGERERQTDKRS